MFEAITSKIPREKTDRHRDTEINRDRDKGTETDREGQRKRDTERDTHTEN